MGVIDPNNSMGFVPAASLYSRIKRRLNSYKTVGLIDEGDFAEWTNDVLSQLYIAVLREADAILVIENGKAKLPDYFKSHYASYKCHPGTGFRHNTTHFQGGWVFFRDITKETILKSGNCELHQEGKCLGDGVFEKMTVREYINQDDFGHNDGFRDLDFHIGNHLPLRLNPNIPKHPCQDDCSTNLNHHGHRGHHHHSHEINIDVPDGYVYAQFEDCIYMKYYAQAIDPETNSPMIPDLNSIQRAIENYIIWQLFLMWYWNNDVPDVIQKAGKAEQLYWDSLKQASYETKLPGFQTMVNKVRMNKGTFQVFRQTDQFGYWQRF